MLCFDGKNYWTTCWLTPLDVMKLFCKFERLTICLRLNSDNQNQDKDKDVIGQRHGVIILVTIPNDCHEKRREEEGALWYGHAG